MWNNRVVIVYTGLALGSCGLVSWLFKRSFKKKLLHKRKLLPGYEQLIGNTPMIRLGSLSEVTGCEILAKVEFLNPGGTGKDRIAINMIREAEMSGKLGQKGMNTVFEGSSGSTGISLAALCNSKGYKCKVALPDDQVGGISLVLFTQEQDIRVILIVRDWPTAFYQPTWSFLIFFFYPCALIFVMLSGRGEM